MAFSTGPVSARSHTEEPADPADRPRILRVLLVALLGFAALLGWSFASPVGASPDDNFHMTSIWCAAGERPGLCESTDEPGEKAVPAGVANASACFAFRSEHSGRCDTELSGMVVTGHGNFAGVYPPIYYATMSPFVSTDVQTSVLLMRAFNSLLAVTLISSLYLLVDRKLRAPLLWGLLLTAIPAGIFLIASVNPSGWAILSAGTLWVALAGYLRAPTATRRIALGGIALLAGLMGAGSRGDSAMYVALGAVLAVIITFERSRRFLISLILPVVTAGMAAAFYLGSNQVGAALEGEMTGVAPEKIDLVSGLIRTVLNIPKLWVGNFGSQPLGWGDTDLPTIVWFTTFVLYVGVGFWTLSRPRGARMNFAILLAGLALVMVPSWVIVQNGVDVGVLVQPRYVLPLQVILIGLLLFGAGDPRVDLSRLQRWIIVLGLAGANTISLYANMRRYLTGTDYAGLDLNSGIEWWWQGMPIPPGAFWIVGSVAFATLLVFAAGLFTRRRASVDRSATDDALAEVPSRSL